MGHEIKWHQIIINDPECLPGRIIYDIIQILLQQVEFKFIILNDIEGAAQDWLMPKLFSLENEVLNIENFLNIVCEVQQFDWGDFFLFKEYPVKWSNPQKITYPYVIMQTDTTLRAVDDQYVYIYTPHQKIVDALVSTNYTIESIKTDVLEKLEYPF